MPSDTIDCSVHMAIHAELNLLTKLSIWDFHDNVSSNIKPKNLMCCTLDMGLLIWSVFISILLLFFILKCKTCIFYDSRITNFV